MAGATIALLDPQITINNEIVQIVPNSAVLRLGFGEDSTEVVSAGNGATDIVVGSNVETKKSMLTVGIKNTADAVNLITNFKRLRGKLTVSIIEGSFNKILRKATVINDPEFTFSNDSNISVEIEGLTAQ
jgi:hypothetical protein